MTNNNKANRGCSNKTYISYQDLYQMMTSLNCTWLQVCPSGLIHFLDLSGSKWSQNGQANPNLKNPFTRKLSETDQISCHLFYGVRLNLVSFTFHKVKPNFDKVFSIYCFHGMNGFLPQGVPESQKQCRLTYKLVGTGINYNCPKV